jgi:catechol 2,3-dioxygenase-like lactoylglutathione lyase family enzyme
MVVSKVITFTAFPTIFPNNQRNRRMIKFRRVDHVQICIPTGAEEEARRFYAGILGLTEIPKPQALIANGGLWYRVADIQLHIGTEKETNKSKRHPAFEVSDIGKAKVYLADRGVEIKEEIQIPGQIRFSFKDPFNNRIELLQHI